MSIVTRETLERRPALRRLLRYLQDNNILTKRDFEREYDRVWDFRLSAYMSHLTDEGFVVITQHRPRCWEATDKLKDFSISEV